MPLDLVKCGMCGKAVVIETGKRAVCEKCSEEERILYKKICTLLRDCPEAGLGIADVARIMKVDERKITYFVDNGMLQLVRNNRLANPDKDRGFL